MKTNTGKQKMSDTPKVIKTMSEYEAILARILVIFDAKPNTPEGDELELLSKLTFDYEENGFNDEENKKASK